MCLPALFYRPERGFSLAPDNVAHALVRAVSRLVSTPPGPHGQHSVENKTSPRVATRHARVRAPRTM
jgi:hypothetical protein